MGEQRMSDLLAAAATAYRDLPPVERALHDSDQRRSWIRGMTEREPPPEVLADEVRRLRTTLARVEAERDALKVAAVKAVEPLEAMRIGGTLRRHTVDIEMAALEGIAAVRAALRAPPGISGEQGGGA